MAVVLLTLQVLMEEARAYDFVYVLILQWCDIGLFFHADCAVFTVYVAQTGIKFYNILKVNWTIISTSSHSSILYWSACTDA